MSGVHEDAAEPTKMKPYPIGRRGARRPCDGLPSHHLPHKIELTVNSTTMSFEDHETRTSFGDSFVRWPLRDCSGVRDPLPEEKMVSWFARWRRTRSKPVTETHSVTQRSLDQAWTAFVLHWKLR
ncbi:hypothetical protein F444_23020 [Phytophthora nicotianae P1976]|uniref:Uncharacterized protein n=1 Tax=Phytophthora nicotianae P1976 TaxID=1317066 RepID=A0A080YW43_PHYNI|nr:hypothetical protein F444_23020 [Phytophthora nicotianae P1976]